MHIFYRELQVRRLKDKETCQLSSRANRYLEKLEITFASFMSSEEGPYMKNIDLEQVLLLIEKFERKMETVTDRGNDLNRRQKVFKQPIAHFHTLRYV